MAVSRSQQFELQFRREMIQERLERILRESPSALGEKIQCIRNFFTDEWRRSILGRYQIAVLIRDIYNDVTDNQAPSYGAKAVDAIKDAFDWDAGVIYQAMNVAETFTLKDIEAIADMRMPDGRPISYSHVAVLANEEDPVKRQKLLKLTVKEGWTSKRLSNAVDLSELPQPDKQEDRRGRPLAVPRNFDAVLNQQDSFVLDFLNRNDQVWAHEQHSLSARTREMDTADFTIERADRLKHHAESMVLLARKAQERADEATKVHQAFLEIIKKRDSPLKRITLPSE